MSEGNHTLPTGMTQVKAPVLANSLIGRDHYQMRLKAPLVARRAKPGQFVHLQCAPSDSKKPINGYSYSPLLRRPLSLLDADPERGTVELIYKVVGLGTAALAQIPVGSRIDLLGPLGHPFEIPPNLRRAYLVGGGVGIPPLFLLAKRLKAKAEVVAFLGARTKEWVICRSQFRRIGVPVHVATDDGSAGYRGSVVDLVKRFLRSAPHPAQSTVLYICGPTPMMAAAAAVAQQENLPAQVSVEERMGCAMGCCWGCVVEIADEDPRSHARYQRVCTEGPVFPAEAIAWRKS